MTVEKIYAQIVRARVLEDRREYQIDDLKKAYPQLTWQQATELHAKIQANFKSEF